LAVVVAVGGTALATIAARELTRGVVLSVPLYLVVVLLVTWFAGWRAGVATTFVVGVAEFSVVRAVDRLRTGDARDLIPPLYVVVGALGIVAITNALDIARRRAELAADRLHRLASFDAALVDVDDAASARERITELAVTAAGARAGAIVRADEPVLPESEGGPILRRLPMGNQEGGFELGLFFDHLPPDRVAFESFLETIARQAGVALERVALRRAELRAREDERLVSEASVAFAGTLDAEKLVTTFTDLVEPTLADRCTVTIFERDVEGAGAIETSVDGERHRLSVPLVSLDRRLGQVDLWRRRAFDEHDVALLEQLASRAAQALDNALLYDQQTRTKSTLERSLLPHALLPVEGLRLAARFFPGAANLEVGGDFYDAVTRDDGSLVLVIGDVQGKGVEAATLTAVARHTLRSAALGGVTPSGMLTRLNLALSYAAAEQEQAGGYPDARFVTAAVVELRPQDDGFHVVGACAGHPPPLVVRADGSVSYLRAKGVLLGLFDEPVLREAETDLRTADTIVLYTDGVTELRHGGQWFDDVELGRLLHNRRAQVDAEAIAQLIQDTVLLLSGGTPKDDIAILVASVEPRDAVESA
jgi:serine phosphatase RsbU (regulator of sigma subunit)